MPRQSIDTHSGTAIPPSTACISIRDDAIDEVSPEIYGGFVEHLGRNVYGGVYAPESPLADEQGFRRDVMEAVRQLGMPVTRYPGGCFTDTWRWEDGVGPKERRPVRLNYAWKQSEPNWFGLDEFMDWAKKVGTAPVLTVNLSTRGILEAADLLEYCNVPGGTTLSDLRRANGHPTPYNVRTWCLGNELYGGWEIGSKSAREYGALARETAKLMKAYDPSLKMILCGCSFSPRWNREVLEEAYEYIDLISLHETFDRTAAAPLELLGKCDSFARTIEETIRLCDDVRREKNAPNQVDISVDEWIVWDNDKRDLPETRWTVGRPLLEQDFTALEAVLTGELFSMFHNHADRVKLACVAQSVNVIAPIRAEADGTLWHQTTFYPFQLASHNGRGTALRVENASPELYGSAVLSENGLAIFLTARSETPLPFQCLLPERCAENRLADAVVIGGESLLEANGPGREPVQPQPLSGLSKEGHILSGCLPPFSWTCIRIRP